MNAARKINAQKEGTYLTANEKVIVKTDKLSVFDLYGTFPDWVLYTELAGTSSGSKGIMRLASEIKVKWIEKKLPLLEKVDLERLEHAGEPPVHSGEKRTKLTVNQIDQLIDQNKKEIKIKEEQKSISREDKVAAAKERMLERKRQKIN